MGYIVKENYRENRLKNAGPSDDIPEEKEPEKSLPDSPAR